MHLLSVTYYFKNISGVDVAKIPQTNTSLDILKKL